MTMQLLLNEKAGAPCDADRKLFASNGNKRLHLQFDLEHFILYGYLTLFLCPDDPDREVRH